MIATSDTEPFALAVSAAKFRDQQSSKPAHADVQIRDQLTSEFAIKATP
jgi:hypothetical protein